MNPARNPVVSTSPPQNLVTPEDVEALIDTRTNPRDRALIDSSCSNRRHTSTSGCKNTRDREPTRSSGVRSTQSRARQKSRYALSISACASWSVLASRPEKPVNPHHFRHSRATYLANYLTEAQMCEWFGWVHGSRVPG